LYFLQVSENDDLGALALQFCKDHDVNASEAANIATELYNARQGAQEAAAEDEETEDEEAVVEQDGGEEETGRLYETMLGQLKGEQIARSKRQPGDSADHGIINRQDSVRA
jgi:hypothetical protein